MPRERSTTWILIADCLSAKILVNRGAGTGLVPLRDGVFEGLNAPARKIASDRPGRAFDSHGHGHGRHAMEPSSDPHDYEKARFARTVASYLGTAAGRRAFDQLVVVAPPQALGLLRAALPSAAADRVAQEHAKDLTKVPDHQLGRHLRAFVTL